MSDLTMVSSSHQTVDCQTTSECSKQGCDIWTPHIHRATQGVLSLNPVDPHTCVFVSRKCIICTGGIS